MRSSLYSITLPPIIILFFCEKWVNITTSNRIVTPFKYCHIFHWTMCDYWRVSKQFQTSIWANLPIKFLNLNVSGILRDTSLIQSPSHFGKDSMEFPTGQNQYTHMTPHQKTVSDAVFSVGPFPPAHQVQPQNFQMVRAGQTASYGVMWPL